MSMERKHISPFSNDLPSILKSYRVDSLSRNVEMTFVYLWACVAFPPNVHTCPSSVSLSCFRVLSAPIVSFDSLAFFYFICYRENVVFMCHFSLFPIVTDSLRVSRWEWFGRGRWHVLKCTWKRRIWEFSMFNVVTRLKMDMDKIYVQNGYSSLVRVSCFNSICPFLKEF